MMVSTSEFRNGLKIELGGEPFLMIEFQHVKPGKGGAFVRTKLKSLKTKSVLEKTFRSGEKIEVPNIEEKEMQYLYKDKDRYIFMDNQTYEQISVAEDQLGGSQNYLRENINVTLLFHNKVPIEATLPTFVELKIIKTSPGLKGDTVSGGNKPATLETGAVVQVPLFLNEGDVVKIDTRTGEYIERVK